MKNRYRIENGIITGTDWSYTATTVYETDENLITHNKDGAPLYKVSGKSLVPLSSAEIAANTPVKKIFNDDQIAEIHRLIDEKVKKA